MDAGDPTSIFIVPYFSLPRKSRYCIGGEKMEFETIVSIAGAVSLTVELMRLVQWLDRPRRGNGKDSV